MSRARRRAHCIVHSKAASHRFFRDMARMLPLGPDSVLREFAGPDPQWPPVPVKPSTRRKR